MARTKISEFSSTPANNTDIDSINIAEGCAPSNINDAIRELMAQLKDFQTGAVGDSFNGPIGSSTASTGAFTNITASGTLGVTGVATLGAGAILNTPASVTLTNATGLPISTGVSGLGTGVATALAVNVGSAGAPVVNGGALGTPSSGTVTNLTGTASININGTVGATTPTTGAFTTTTVSTSETLSYGTANGVTYLNGSKVLTSGSALTFDGTGLNINGDGLYLSGNTGGSAYVGASSNNGASELIFGTFTNIPVRFIQSNSEQMRLTSTGLGIGTSSPAVKLQVNGSGQILRVTDGTTGASIYSGGGLFGFNNQTGEDGMFGSTASHFLYWATNGAERMRLDSAGNLGLGVTPSAWSTTYNKAFQLPAGSISAYTTIAVSMNQNAYYSGSAFNYVNNGFAERYEQYNGTHAWFTAASGTAGNAISFTQAMTLDASGNLLVGTTSSSFSAANRTVLALGSGSNGSLIDFQVSGGTSDGYIYADGTNFTIENSNSGYIRFNTAASERARIDSSGNLLVGRTSAIASERLSVEGSNTSFISRIRNTSATTPSGIFISYTAAAPNDTGNSFFRADDNAATRAEIRSNGGIANYSANNVNLSDVRTKTDIQNAGGYLAKICAIPVRTFKYKDQTDDLLNLGVIAQEVEAVAPEFVDTTGFGELPEDGVPLKAIYQTDLQYALMKALQELKAEFDAYKASHP